MYMYVHVEIHTLTINVIIKVTIMVLVCFPRNKQTDCFSGGKFLYFFVFYHWFAYYTCYVPNYMYLGVSAILRCAKTTRNTLQRNEANPSRPKCNEPQRHSLVVIASRFSATPHNDVSAQRRAYYKILTAHVWI